MVYLYNDIESRYTILAGNPRFVKNNLHTVYRHLEPLKTLSAKTDHRLFRD